jgi:hypothetical protein
MPTLRHSSAKPKLASRSTSLRAILNFELIKRSDNLDEVRLQRVVDSLPWALARLERKLVS